MSTSHFIYDSQPLRDRPYSAALAARERVWHAGLPIHRVDGSPVDRLNSLISAIDAIADFARANAHRYLTPKELLRLRGLDSRFGFLCNAVGPGFNSAPPPSYHRTRAKRREPFGCAFIPQHRRPGDGRPRPPEPLTDIRLNPSAEWETAMGRLKEAAEALRDAGGRKGRGPDGGLTRKGMEEIIEQGGGVGYDGPDGHRLVTKKEDLPSEEELALLRADPLEQANPAGFVVWCEAHLRKLVVLLQRYPDAARRGLSCATAFVQRAAELAVAIDATAAAGVEGGAIRECVAWPRNNPLEAIGLLDRCAEWGRKLSEGEAVHEQAGAAAQALTPLDEDPPYPAIRSADADTETLAVPVDEKAESETGMLWKDAAERMERLRTQGEPFTTQEKMAKQLGCSPATINKAIKHTPELHPWAKPRAKPRAAAPMSQNTNDVATDHSAQSTEPDPADDTAYAELRKAFEQAGPDERAFLNEMLEASREFQIWYVEQGKKAREDHRKKWQEACQKDRTTKVWFLTLPPVNQLEFFDDPDRFQKSFPRV